MRMKKIRIYVTIACIVIPFIIAVILYFLLPDTIPAHWSIAGEIDRYGNKAEVFIVPSANIPIILMFLGFFKIILIAASSGENSLTLKQVTRITDISTIVVNIIFLGLCIWYFIHLYSNAFT